MFSITRLFEGEQQQSVPKKYKKRVSKKCNHFKGFEDSLPELKYPKQNTQRFEEDLDEVRRCVRNPSLSKKFLNKSHKKSEALFKKLIKDEECDWVHLNEILDEFDGVVTRLKFKYDRPRPYVYFRERGEDLKTKEHSSPSFPSGHAAFAYFICDYLSNLLPHRQKELESLAELVCQSRIENGVHFPSDVSAGRFVGEQAANFLIGKYNIQEGTYDRHAQKIFVKFLRRRSKDLRPKFAKSEALRAYAVDMSIFISETLGTCDGEALHASKSLLEGYRIEECTDDKKIIRFFEGMCHSFFTAQRKMSDIVVLNKILESSSTLRSNEKITLSGISHSPISKIEEFSSKLDKFNNKPFLKLAAINWIAPFEKGNSKITNIIFLKETGFNFDITNQVLCDDLPTLLERFYIENDMKKLFS